MSINVIVNVILCYVMYLFVLTLNCFVNIFLKIEFLNLEPNTPDRLRLMMRLGQSFARFKADEILERRDASDKHKQTCIIKYYLLMV